MYLHSRDVFVNFSTHIFYTPPTLSPVATSAFPPPTSPHSLPPTHSTPPPHLCHRRQGPTSGAICIYITHVTCSVLLELSRTAWYQHDTPHTCHLQTSSQGSFHLKHEWNRADSFSATCPAHPRLLASPHSTSLLLILFTYLETYTPVVAV